MVVVVGQGGYLAHQMCEDHVCRNAAKLRILNTNHRTHITTISPTPKGGLTTVPILSWRGPSVAKGPHSPGLDALWHRRRRTVAYYAIRLLWTYMFCWVYYTRTWWENVLNMSQFTMIWSNISVLYGTPAPTGFGDSHTWSLNIKTMANNLTLWQTLSKHMIARKPEVIKDRSTRSKELQDE